MWYKLTFAKKQQQQQQQNVGLWDKKSQFSFLNFYSMAEKNKQKISEI